MNARKLFEEQTKVSTQELSVSSGLRIFGFRLHPQPRMDLVTLVTSLIKSVENCVGVGAVFWNFEVLETGTLNVPESSGYEKIGRLNINNCRDLLLLNPKLAG